MDWEKQKGRRSSKGRALATLWTGFGSISSLYVPGDFWNVR